MRCYSDSMFPFRDVGFIRPNSLTINLVQKNVRLTLGKKSNEICIIPFER